ncbi:pumilio homolog 24 [Tanacetum coccineum]|uniref:Pumilio homolog 24 n=1 Tax=Tanacetum coccineum TaxID=301880 RepID=A0ABQ5H785_9ASTR
MKLSWGDLPKEANLLEKSGEFQEVAMCLIWYVLFRVAWGDGNRGWPLKQFEQMEEICNKVKSLAKRISKAGCMIWMVVAKVLPGAFKITVHLGKIHEIASSHVSCRVLQTYAKYCSQDERNAVNQKLKPHFLTLACSTYAVYLITKMLDNASKEQVAEFISSLHGHNQSLLMELYSTELQLFKNLGQLKERRLVDIIAKLNSSSEAYVSCVATDFRKRNNRSLLLTQGNCGTSAADVIQHVSSALLIRMIHTKDRSKIGILCIKHGSAQETFVEGYKGGSCVICYPLPFPLLQPVKDLLAEARFCSDVELTEKEIERMVMEASRAEYIANDKFKHQLGRRNLQHLKLNHRLLEASKPTHPLANGFKEWPSGSESKGKEGSVLCSMQMVLSIGFSYVQSMEAYSIFGDDVDSIVSYLLETNSRRKGKATEYKVQFNVKAKKGTTSFVMFDRVCNFLKKSSYELCESQQQNEDYHIFLEELRNLIGKNKCVQG